VAVFGTSWSHLYSLRNMWQCSELLDHTCAVLEMSQYSERLYHTCTVFEIWQYSELLDHTCVLFKICDYSELLDHTRTVFEICDSIRNFLITPVPFSKYVTVFGTSWSHLYSLRNATVFESSWSHLFFFEMYDSIRWRNLTIGLWRMAQTDIDFWSLIPGLNPTSVRVGFVEVKKVVLRMVILWALRLSPVNIVPICSIHISHRQCILSTSFQPLWKIFLEKTLLYVQYVGTSVVCHR
jgi:hypothetical protein